MVLFLTRHIPFQWVIFPFAQVLLSHNSAVCCFGKQMRYATDPMKKTTVTLILTGLLFWSCSNDSEADLGEPNIPETITYEGNIKQIISNNCLTCHSDPPANGAPFALNTYDRVRNRIENGNLLTAIDRQTGQVGAMPPPGRMPQATIDMIKQWADKGFLEQ